MRLTDIGEYRDLMTINDYSRLKKEGGDVGAFRRTQAEVSPTTLARRRSGLRTAMPGSPAMCTA
jgi:hypothetical protein